MDEAEKLPVLPDDTRQQNAAFELQVLQRHADVGCLVGHAEFHGLHGLPVLALEVLAPQTHLARHQAAAAQTAQFHKKAPLVW